MAPDAPALRRDAFDDLRPTDLDVLGGPAWLVARRREALARGLALPLPSTDEEVWRYSRIGALDADRYEPHFAAPATVAGPVPAGAQRVLDAVGDAAGTMVLVDGVVVAASLDPALAGRGVRLGSLVDAVGTAAGPDPAAVEAVLGSVGDDVSNDRFGELNLALSRPVVLDLPAGVVLTAPVVVVDWLTAARRATFPRLVVRAGPDSEATVVEWHGSDDVDALAVPFTELDLAPAARLRHVLVQDRGPQVWQVGRLVARVEASATVSSIQLALGGSYARTRADCRLVGRGASGQLDAAYFGANDQMLDFRTFHEHVAADTTSNLLFKGAVGGRSQSVYTGLIRVGPEARGTNAFQTNRNLKLSDGAWAESVPNLEIENNDVHCSHASTVGPVDEDQRFYLESRGVPPGAADRLIVNGFFAEVLRRVGVAGVEAMVRQAIDDRLAAEGTTDASAPAGTSAGRS